MKTAGFLNGRNGVRYSVYPAYKEKRIPASFFFAKIFEWALMYRVNCRFEFLLVQSRVDPKGFTANSLRHFLEWIRIIPAGAKDQPVGMFAFADNLFFKSDSCMVCVFSFAFSRRRTAISLPDRIHR